MSNTIENRLIREKRCVLYVGKAVCLRNRLQQHKMWRIINEDSALENSLAEISVDVWYLPREEHNAAEATLMALFNPVYNKVRERSPEWEFRLPDLQGVDYMTIRPETRDDAGSTCPIENKPGVYAWILESNKELVDWLKTLLLKSREDQSIS